MSYTVRCRFCGEQKRFHDELTYHRAARACERCIEEVQTWLDEVLREIRPGYDFSKGVHVPRLQPKILRNAARCKKCGDVIESRYRHDFVWCKCKAIFVDGGLDYLRRGGDMAQLEDLSEVQEEPLEDPSSAA